MTNFMGWPSPILAAIVICTGQAIDVHMTNEDFVLASQSYDHELEAGVA